MRSLLSHVHSPELRENVHLLADATFVEDDPETPYTVEHHVREVIDGTEDRMLGFTNGLGSPSLTETAYERLQRGASLEWIFTPETLEHFRSQYDELGERALESENTAFYVLDEAPINLAIYDETLIVIGFDDDRGVLSAVAITQSPEAVAWGQRVIERYRATAERVA